MRSRLFCSLVILMLENLLVLAQNCLDSDLMKCMTELKVLTNNQDLAFAVTESELNVSCGHLQKAMLCVNDFTDRCFERGQKEMYRSLTSGAQELILDLCTPGSSFRSRYLKHAPCYKSLHMEYARCTEMYTASQDALKQTDMANEAKLLRSCCNFDAYKACIRRSVLAKCSSEAAEIGEQIISKAEGALVQTYCAEYKHDSPECASCGATLTSLWTRIVAMTSLVIFIYAYRDKL